MSAVYGQSPATPPDNGTTEKSVKSCYAVIYTLKNRKWAVAGEGGWSECHLCLDTLDNSYRILAWTVKSQEVLMNCNVVADCSYKEKSKNFHSFTDENGDRYGLGFHKSESGLKQAQQFLKSVTGVIKNCKSESDYMQTPQKMKNHENSQSTSVVPPLGYQNSHDKSHLNNDSMILKNGNNSNSINNNSNNNNNNNNVSNDVINENEESYYIDPNWKPDENGGYYDDDGYYYNDKGQLTGYYDEYGEYFEYTEADLKQFYQSNNSNIKADLSRSDTKKFMLKQKSNSKRNISKNKIVIPPPPPDGDSNNNNNNNNISNNNNNYKIIKNNNNGNHATESKQDELNPKPLLSQSHTSEAQNENSTSSDLMNTNYGKLKSGNNYNSIINNNNNNIKSLNNNTEYEYKQKKSIITPDPKYHLQNRQYKSIPNMPIKTQLGSLKILPPKPGKLKNPGDKAIKNPNKVELKVRVLYDPTTQSYTGLPQEWLQELNRQFGVAPKSLPGIKIDKYNAKVPKVLVTLVKSIKSNNGWKQVGIFRLAPNATESTKTKNEINTNGKLVIDNNSNTDVNVYANLIKVWFRDLPQPILNCIDPTRVELVSNTSDALKVINIMPEPQKSIFLWLCDMCVECSQYSKINKMNSQNLAIVIGPNLFNTNDFENPMKAMTFSGKVVEFFKHAINLRIALAQQNGTYKQFNE